MRRHLGASLIRSARPADPDAGRSASELLARFAETRDEEAFAALVRRYGRMVFAVCRRGAGHPQDAEDAFQAVFLVLARKAGRVGHPDLLGNWLYGVAVRVAGRARRAAARRARREVATAVVPDRGAVPPDPAFDLRPVVERELAALPSRFRQAVELCDLGGLSRAEAAEAMGVPEGTVSSRLTTGRGLLAARLTRRGVTLGAAGLVAAPATGFDAARLVGPTVGRVLGGAANEHVRALARWGGLDMGVWTRLAGVLTVAGVTVGVVAAWGGRPADDPPKRPAPKESPKAEAKVAGPAAKAPGRPRMTRRVELPGTYSLAAWSPDGKHLALAGADSVLVCGGHDLAAQNQPLTGPGAVVLGFRGDPPVLLTYKAGAGRINREESIQFWGLQGGPLSLGGRPAVGQTTHHRPDRVTRLADDAGEPIALLPDGKGVLTRYDATRRDPNAPARQHPTVVAYILRVVDPATGEVVRDVARSDAVRRPEYRLSPDATSLAVLADFKDVVRLELWDVATGRQRWGEEVQSLAGGRPEFLNLQPPVFSPDGSTLAVAVPRPPTPLKSGPVPPGTAPRPPRFEYEGAEIRYFAAADGAERGKPDEQSPYLNIPVQFSHDGRLLLGRRSGRREADSLAIWDAGTGRLVKRWNDYVPALFAPDRPALAILEDTSYQDGNNLVRQAVLALWDVSDLVK